MSNKKSSRGSKLQARLPESSQPPPEPLPEMELDTFCRVIRIFGIVTDVTEREPYWVRLMGRPYNAFVPGCPSVRIMAHNRGRLLVSPRHVRHALAKFGIDERDFYAAYEEFLTRPDVKSVLADTADSGSDRMN